MKGVASAGPRGKRSRLQRDFTCSTVARVARALRTQVAAQVLPPRARRARALERGLPARRHLPDRRQAVAHPAGPRVARGGARRDRGGARARGAGRRRRARPGARARAAARRRRARAGRAERRRRARPGAAAQERARPLSRGARRSDDSLVSIPRSDPSRSRPPASRTTSLAPRSTSFDAPLDVVRAAMLSNENLICVIRRETSADSSSERGGRARAGKLGAGSSCNKRSFRASSWGAEENSSGSYNLAWSRRLDAAGPRRSAFVASERGQARRRARARRRAAAGRGDEPRLLRGDLQDLDEGQARVPVREGLVLRAEEADAADRVVPAPRGVGRRVPCFRRMTIARRALRGARARRPKEAAKRVAPRPAPRRARRR